MCEIYYLELATGLRRGELLWIRLRGGGWQGSGFRIRIMAGLLLTECPHRLWQDGLQDLRCIKPRGDLEVREGMKISSHNSNYRRRDSGWRHYPLSGGQAKHLACRKRLPGAFAGVARTYFALNARRAQARGGQAGESLCRGCVAPVFRFQEEGRRCPCRGYLDSVGSRVGRRLSGTVMTR